MFNKQLLDKDIYEELLRRRFVLSAKLKAREPARTEFNNRFIIYFYLYLTQGKWLHCKQVLFFEEAIRHKPHKLV